MQCFYNVPFVIGVCSLENQVYCIGGTYGPSGTKYCFRLNKEDTKWDRIANLQQGNFNKGCRLHDMCCIMCLGHLGFIVILVCNTI